jgi:D-arabinose 1-dehydrogenase-like Zn-dependent alcohol dehydrogenase
MKYEHIVISRFGGPETLLLVKDEIPEPRANEVRVKVLAAGVSFADILIEKEFIRNLGILESWNLGILEEHHLPQDGMLLASLTN